MDDAHRSTNVLGVDKAWALEVQCLDRLPTRQCPQSPDLHINLPFQDAGLCRSVHPQPPAGLVVAADPARLQLELVTTAEADVLRADLEVGDHRLGRLHAARALLPPRLVAQLVRPAGARSAPPGDHPQDLENGHHCEQDGRGRHPGEGRLHEDALAAERLARCRARVEEAPGEPRVYAMPEELARGAGETKKLGVDAPGVSHRP
mmetsp:Transcript_161418/g.518276  ORF Transcript_161418/g.518276 Transcript_161418/m.518276 type:complete len:205 (-) Transcript_161418:1575-2189(-)